MSFQSSCSNCHELERKIITLFTSKYELKRSIGTEYFEGDYRKMIRDICDIVSSEEIVDEAVRSVIKNVIVEDYEKIIHDTVVDEVIKNVIVEDYEKIIHDTVVDEVIKNVIVDDVVDSEEIIDDTVVDKDMNANSDQITNDTVVNDSSQIRNDDDQFCCMTCKYFTNVKSNLQKHFHTKKHISLVTPEAVDTTTASKWQCNVCDKYYKSQSGLWKHSQVCKEVVPIPEVVFQDLHTKIDNLEKIIVEMAKSNNRQQ